MQLATYSKTSLPAAQPNESITLSSKTHLYICFYLTTITDVSIMIHSVDVNIRSFKMTTPQRSVQYLVESIEEFDQAIRKVEALRLHMTGTAENTDTVLSVLQHTKTGFEKASGKVKALSEEYTKMKLTRNNLAAAIIDREDILDKYMSSPTKDGQSEAARAEGELQALLKQQQELRADMKGKFQAIQPAQNNLDLYQDALKGFTWIMGDPASHQEDSGALASYFDYLK